MRFTIELEAHFVAPHLKLTTTFQPLANSTSYCHFRYLGELQGMSCVVASSCFFLLFCNDGLLATGLGVEQLGLVTYNECNFLRILSATNQSFSCCIVQCGYGAMVDITQEMKYWAEWAALASAPSWTSFSLLFAQSSQHCTKRAFSAFLYLIIAPSRLADLRNNSHVSRHCNVRPRVKCICSRGGPLGYRSGHFSFSELLIGFPKLSCRFDLHWFNLYYLN